MRLRDPHSSEATGSPVASRPLRLLIVDDEPAVRDALTVALEPRAATVHHADSLASARRILLASPIDLALIDVRLPDGDGLRLADELGARTPAVPAIVITGQPSLDRAVGALRAGASDFLAKPFDLEDLNRCVSRALTRREHDRALALRIHKLRRTCRKLHKARSSVSQQVDILCSDLVTAYQQLAEEFKSVQASTRYQTQVEGDLDLESLLRRTLEFVLDQTGPTNAAIFLPGLGGGYTVGGYVNYTFSRSEADVLLDHLASLAAAKIAESDGPIHLTSEQDVNLWLSAECEWLRGSHVLAVPVRNEEETLGALLLFRDASEPYEDEARGAVASMSRAFADQLVKVIAVHHRAKGDGGDDDDDREGDDFSPFSGDDDGGLQVPF